MEMDVTGLTDEEVAVLYAGTKWKRKSPTKIEVEWSPVDGFRKSREKPKRCLVCECGSEIFIRTESSEPVRCRILYEEDGSLADDVLDMYRTDFFYKCWKCGKRKEVD